MWAKLKFKSVYGEMARENLKVIKSFKMEYIQRQKNKSIENILGFFHKIEEAVDPAE